MENNEEKKSITIKQGTGDEAIDMTIQVTQEELDTMERIRKYSPENWKGKELELLQEARKIIKEKPVVSPMPQKETAETVTIDIEEPKHKNAGLWWTLGILAALFIAYQSFMYYVKQQTKDLGKIIQHSASNYTKKTISFEGISFDYPGNWSFVKNKTSSEMFMIEGGNGAGLEYVVMVFKSTEFMPVKDCIDAVVAEFAELDEGGGNIDYSAIYAARFNGMDVLASDCNYKYKGRTCYAQVKGFELYGNSITIISSAYDKIALSGDDFKIMENSFKFTQTN